jgi:S-adenosylmethionine:tRNA ribosyltransferase-isomerase
MRIEDFDYELPEELIAQKPIEKRDQSRLMVIDRKSGNYEHKRFFELVNYLQAGDALILNDTKVIPARLIGTKEKTGANVEIFLLKRIDKDHWETLVRPAKRLPPGSRVSFGDGALVAEIVKDIGEGMRIVAFCYQGVFEEILDRFGQMPLPPYIKEKLEDKERYQTVYAKIQGSAAAPTAGLHFTGELLEKLQQKGIIIGFITLHVGLGTFRPVQTERIEDHQMHSEYFTIDQRTADLVNMTKDRGKRVIAVGTTTIRTLETAWEDGLQPQNGWTDIFIYPGYQFKVVDGIITNFHLPKSTLIMLVSAFLGRENTLRAYNEAVRQRYRFFSFGDAMLII